MSPMVQWGWPEILANRTNYLLELIIWQNATPQKKGQQAKHNSKKPKPFTPEFMKPKQLADKPAKDDQAMTVDDIKSWLSVPRGV